MAVTIGHASIDENQRANSGSAGDQTKKEVCTRSWYSKPWTSVIRPKDGNVAEKIATAMEQACANDNIGYDQYQRTTLYTQAKALNWDISKVTTKCECDCSSLVAVCVNASGISVSKDIYTGNELKALEATGGFTILTEAKYISRSDYLKRGDILLGKGHTAVVLSNGTVATQPTAEKPTATKKATDYARSFLRPLSGSYKVTASKLNVRTGAGLNKKVMVAIPRGTVVTCYGYYTTVLGTNWLYVQFDYEGTTYTGFASEKYLKK